MAKRQIIQDSDPVLRKKARKVTDFDERLHMLLDDMKETMNDANGAGLAAPQVGILRSVAVIEVEEDDLIEMINPEIVEAEGEYEAAEGCLSFPGIWGIVARPERVVVHAQNRFGEEIEIEGRDLVARALCHEIDHLNGLVFVDKVIRFIDPEKEEPEDATE